MTHKDERHASPAQVSEDAEQVTDLVRRDGRGGFVHEEDSRLQRQRLGDLDELHLRHAQLVDRRRRRRVETDHLDPRFRQSIDRGAVDQDAPSRGDALEQNVLRHSELRDEVALLVHDADTRGKR